MTGVPSPSWPPMDPAVPTAPAGAPQDPLLAPVTPRRGDAAAGADIGGFPPGSPLDPAGPHRLDAPPGSPEKRLRVGMVHALSMDETGEHVWTEVDEMTPDDYVTAGADTESAATQLVLDKLIENGVFVDSPKDDNQVYDHKYITSR